MKRLDPIFKTSCPNCGGPISAERLEKGLPCEACLPNATAGTVTEIAQSLAKRGVLKGYLWLYDLAERFDDFKVFFEARVGSSLWSAQASWAKRLLSLESLAIIAPTGVGKSTLLQAYASYRVRRDRWRVLYLVPTENLAKQVVERLKGLVGGELAYYYGSMPKALKEQQLERIKKGSYKVLVVTTSFLQRRFDLLSGSSGFNLVIVDDVDSLLRNSRNVDRVLLLLGFSRESIEAAEELVKAKLKLYAALASGKEEKIEELRSRVAEVESRLRASIDGSQGQLVIASATGRPRGIRHLLFKELLGFEVGGGTDYMRNVLDTYKITENPIGDVIEIVKTMGDGGIVFISQLYGKTHAKLVYKKLDEAGIPASLALAGSRRSIEKLASGKVKILVGVASRYGVIVRGLDLPEKVRYAVFLGVPARIQLYEDAVSNPRRLLTLLYYLNDQGIEWAKSYIDKIRKLMDKITDYSIVSMAFKGRIKPEGLLRELISTMKEAADRAEEEFKTRIGVGETLRIGGIVLENSGDKLSVIIPDAPTYLQASGRTSRLYKGTMTYGVSIILERRKDLVEALWERLSWYTSDKPVDFSRVSVEDELARIEESRKGKGKKVTVKSVLLIVESPTKARTIAWFWGRPSKRRSGRTTIYETSVSDPETGIVYLLTITATRGHLYDLSIDEDDGVYGVIMDNGRIRPVYAPIRRCLDCGYQYAGTGPCPRCGSVNVNDSRRTIQLLRKLATEVDEVIIATDPDREGEKIAWDVYLALKPYNDNIKRGRFHEVTREAVLEALRNANGIEEPLVNAQIVRRIEDRWIGFYLSSHLWSVFGKRWYGAGRVQTPVLGWIIDRYEEYKRGRGYRVVAVLEDGRVYFFTKDKAEAEQAAQSKSIIVAEATYWEETHNPPPPFTTDSLLYEASRRYSYNARFTMKLAQDLFESGLITYHRTDSTRVSKTGMAIAASYLEKTGLKHLYRPRSWGDSGAHEAIRPTRPISPEELERMVYDGTIKVPLKLTRAHIKLYDLIFRRFIASQMTPSTVKMASITLRLGTLNEVVEGPVDYRGEGFHLVYKPRARKWADGLSKGQEIPVLETRVVRASAVSLLKSGDVIQLMKKRGIGRPSTYAKAIEANIRHGYVIESKRLNYLIPTKHGISVYGYLAENFAELVSEETSRRMEERLTSIERGETDPIEVIEDVKSLITGLVDAANLSRTAIST
ncbi:MAG: reverse gyrase [Desulfurococcales archaeon]|nr:reverse gyrase [Desulfurococcales archaeon]